MPLAVQRPKLIEVADMGTLRILPCQDSDELAAARRQELDLPPKTAAALGWSAVDAACNGYYVNRKGQRVDWDREVQAACAAKASIPPDAALPSPRHDPFP